MMGVHTIRMNQNTIKPYLDVCVKHEYIEECERASKGECEWHRYISKQHHDEWMSAMNKQHQNSMDRLIPLIARRS